MQTNNINCFVKICNRFKYKYKIINNMDDYDDTINKLIIPGIGNYSACSKYFKENKIDTIIKIHLEKNKKILGICIGMQILSSVGYENGYCKGLDILKNSKTDKLKTEKILPHIGWNTVKLQNYDKYNLFKGINLNADFYFVHSYCVTTQDNKIILGTSNYYDIEFISVINTNNILAVQFHPEKSGSNGIKLIENFLNW